MTDWPELDALSQKRKEIEQEKAALQKAKDDEKRKIEDEKRRNELARQDYVQSLRPRIEEVFSQWNPIITNHLSRIAEETWQERKKVVSNYPSNLDWIIESQLSHETSIINWRVSHGFYGYSVSLSIKEFSPIGIVVASKNKHSTQTANENELKKALLLAFEDGPYYEPPAPRSSYEGPDLFGAGER